MPVLDLFVPAVSSWFRETLGEPTPPQEEAWPLILEGKDVVIAAPTGSGKTLAAFLAALDGLAKEAEAGTLTDEVRVVYVSPLKALSNDVGKNLLLPLEGVIERLKAARPYVADIRVSVRTGDTPQKERAAAMKKPPHVLVTTPESLYVLLGSKGGQKLLRSARSLILDEIHAVVGVRRGAHLALSVERLDALCTGHNGRALQRIGLSATQRPIERVAQFVTGSKAPAHVVDAGHARTIDLAIEMPESPLQAVMAGEVFQEVVRRMATLVEQHKTTLIFVNTRRMAERLAARLDEQLGEGPVGKGLVCAHHGSMAREKRLEAEERLKAGKLRALVATASLELGIDVGAVDLVCQMGTTRTIAALLQRVGRAGHHKSLIPKGRIFPLSRDELVEAAALIDAVQTKDLDQLIIPEGATDVLGQHIIAAVAAAGDDGLWQRDVVAVMRKAWPYRNFDDARMDEVVTLAVGGVNTTRGRRGSWLYQDTSVDKLGAGMLRPRKGAGLAALTSGGAIPDMGDYTVIEEPGGLPVGTVNEDFAIESVPGDIFQLGTTSWRIQRVERGVLRVNDARGQPPTLPFWLGEAPGRSLELSAHTDVVKDLVEDMVGAGADEADVAAAFVERFHMLWPAAQQLAQYLCAARAALGTLPTQKRVVVERFEDGLGGTHIVFHSAFGSRINRAWGLSLRKKFCRSFDFELQAAATNDSILLSVGAIGGVELATVPHFVNSKTVRETLVQAILQAPMFGTRFRWNVTRSLTVLRSRAGKRIPPGLLRIAAEDVLVSLFPQQAACAENIVGDREVPDDVLVRQTVDDCLHEAMDLDGLTTMLKGLESGVISLTCVERIDPSPLAYEVLAARPYAFLDDVPLEERRVQAVMGRGFASSALDDETVSLDPLAVQAVLDEVHPVVESEDEAWDALVVFGALQRSELKAVGGLAMPALVDALIVKGRAFEKADVVVAVERKALLDDPTHELLLEVLRGRLEVSGPRPLIAHFQDLGIEESLIRGALERLVRDGTALEGKFVASDTQEVTIWSRRLVTRVRRRMLERLRQEIDPISTQDFMRFLFQHHCVIDKRRGRDGLRAVLMHLDGQVAPAAAWESEILPARVAGFDFGDLDALCLQGEVLWRCRPGQALRAAGERVKTSATGTLVRQTALCFVDADTAAWWPGPVMGADDGAPSSSSSLSSSAGAVRDVLAARGPSFFRDLQRETRQLPTQLEASLQELIGQGVVVADGFAAVRALVRPAKEKERLRRAQKNRPTFGAGFDVAGRFSLVPAPTTITDEQRSEQLARLFLRRHGVVFRRLVERDPVAPPWRDLLLALRRMEVRGEVRGGRFVNGFSGEQFALPEAVSALRAMRRKEKTQERVVLSAADPLNLTGIILPGARIPALVGHRLLFEDGVVVAVFDHNGTRLLDESLNSEVSALSAMLRKKPRRGLLASASP
ncbi:MAG: DEAD/DEAH box helicase [Deltaproteobacteria bacterium]|nr:DEAD/DEAH box helicase [Deltaproteobacteria bacterium]